MAWKKELFAVMENGAEAYRYTLTNQNGVSASFTNLGGIWLTMMVPDRNGDMADVVLGYDDAESYLTNGGHLGELVGRNANRIGNATFTLNGFTYALWINDHEKNNCHSGLDYYRNRFWDTDVEEDDLGTRINFTLFSPDGDQGFPGNAEVAVSYTLTEDNSIIIDYHMTADEDTVANMTHHAYFNLAGQGSGTAMDHKLWIDADQFTPVDEFAIPTGELRSVKGTPLDFTVMKPISQDLGADYEQLALCGGYDHNWVLNHAEGELALAAKAIEEESGRVLEVYTDQPGIQLYTANFLSKRVGKGGAVYDCRHAFCLETQNFPDAINKPEFPSAVLRVGEEYKTRTIYHFGVL